MDGQQPGRRGDIVLFIKKLYNNVFLFVSLPTLGTFIEFWLVDTLVQTFQLLIVIYRRGDFVYHYWWYTSIYGPLYYPLRYLDNSPKFPLISSSPPTFLLYILAVSLTLDDDFAMLYKEFEYLQCLWFLI